MKKLAISFVILIATIFTLSIQASQDEKQEQIETKKEQINSKISLENEIKNFYPKPEYDVRLDVDSRAKEWYEMADEDSASSYNIANTYMYQIKDYKKAEFWYKKAYSIKHNLDALFNLGLLYKTIKKYDKAIFFYKTADEYGDKEAAFNLANLYNHSKKYKDAEDWYKRAYNEYKHKEAAFNLGNLFNRSEKYKNAETWYKKAIEKENLKALQALSILNHKNFKDDIKAVKYYIALADKKYPKEKLIRFFKIKWKLDDETIKKGYEEQLKADDIPESLKYKGGL